MTITYRLDGSGAARLAVYSLTGQRVRTLVNRVESTGSHRLVWDGTDESGRQLASGVYIVRLESAQSALTKRVTLLR